MSTRTSRLRSLHARGEAKTLVRMPPAAADDDTFGDNLAVTDQVFTDDVLIIELALFDRDQRGIADAARLEAAELGPPNRHRRVHGRCGNHVRQLHAHA